MSELTIWGRRNAFNVQKVLWLLDELELDYRHREAGGAWGGLDSPEFLAMNPHGRVPVLQDAALTVWESHAILRYLAARYAGASDARDQGAQWWPAQPADRVRIDAWMDWSLTTLQPDFMRLFWLFYRTPEAQRQAQKIALSVAACDEHFQLLERELAQRPYLAGDACSLADIAAGTALFRYFEMGVPVVRHANVMAWYARLAARPAFRNNIMSPFADLLGRLDY